MANSVTDRSLTAGIIAKETVRQVENNMILGGMVHTAFSKEFNKVGDKINPRKPNLFSAQDGPDITGAIPDVEEHTFEVNLDQHKVVPMEFSASDLTLNIEEFSKRYIDPAAMELAQQVDTAIAGLYSNVYNFTGTPGTAPATFLALGNAGVKMTNNGAPVRPRNAVFDPASALAMADGLKGVFVQDKVRTAIEEARFGKYAGFNTFESASIVKHTVGVATGTPLVNGASQGSTWLASGSAWTQTLNTDGWTNSTTGILKAGDVITIAGVNSVHPVTRQDNGVLQDFVVTADANSGATTGPAALTISPPIITTGPHQTVTAQPADNAAITVKTGTGGSAYGQNMCFHKDALALVTSKFERPKSAEFWGQATGKFITVTVNKQWDAKTYKEVTRLDILFGTKVINAQFAARLTA